MTALNYRAVLRPNQTVASFLSCLAANNGAANMHVFCRHMQVFQAPQTFCSRTVLSADCLNIDRIADLGGVLVDDLARRVVERIDKHWALIGTQKLRQTNIAYEHFRHCPACVRDDLETGRGPDELRSFARLWWLVRTIETCPIHHVRLVCSSRGIDRLLSGDFAHYLRSNQDEVSALYSERQQTPPSAVDDYQYRRLSGDRTNPFLDALPFFGAIELCEMAGGMDISGPEFRRDIATPEKLREARERGFGILGSGIEAFNELLGRTASSQWTGRCPCDGRVYGELYTWLSRKNGDPDFQLLRDAVEAHARANLPLGPDDTFFFETTERRWHSLRTLADRYSIHHTRVEKLLIAGGVTTAGEIARTNGRLLFDVNSVEQFFYELYDRLTARLAAQFLNIQERTFERLVAAGYFTLLPLLGMDGQIRPRCSRDELRIFQERVTRRAIHCERPQRHMLAIYPAARRNQCTYEDVFQLLADEALEELVSPTGKPTLGSLRLNPREVRKKLDQARRGVPAGGELRLRACSGRRVVADCGFKFSGENLSASPRPPVSRRTWC